MSFGSLTPGPMGLHRGAHRAPASVGLCSGRGVQPSPWASASFLQDRLKTQHELSRPRNIYRTALSLDGAVCPQRAFTRSRLHLSFEHSRNNTRSWKSNKTLPSRGCCISRGVDVTAPVLTVSSANQLKAATWAPEPSAEAREAGSFPPGPPHLTVLPLWPSTCFPALGNSWEVRKATDK